MSHDRGDEPPEGGSGDEREGRGMPRALIHHYRSVATERAINILLERMSSDERAELNAKLMAEGSTMQEYVGALLTDFTIGSEGEHGLR